MALWPRGRANAAAFAHRILDLILPPRRSDALVQTLTEETLLALQTHDGYFDGVHAVCLPYRSPEVAALVWEVKYHKNPRALSLAARMLAEEVLLIAEEELAPPLLIPIPMHKKRRRGRGHNQCELLCEAVAASLNESVAYAPQALRRTVLSLPQQGLPRKERLRNAAHSMEAVPEEVRGRACIVIDDVVTTGATLKEARRALRRAGSSAVYLVALAG